VLLDSDKGKSSSTINIIVILYRQQEERTTAAQMPAVVLLSSQYWQAPFDLKLADMKMVPTNGNPLPEYLKGGSVDGKEL
jgi:hypothetical protein